jgi:hypothetical protein
MLRVTLNSGLRRFAVVHHFDGGMLSFLTYGEWIRFQEHAEE